MDDTEAGDEQRERSSVAHLDPVRAGILAVLFVIVLAVVMATAVPNKQGSSAVAPATTTTTMPPAHHHATSTTVTQPRSSIKVQVANGTSVAGAANSVTQKLLAAGWDALPPVNASSSVPSSTVYYAADREWAAEQIAQELSLPASSIQPLTTSVPVPGAAGDDVVVVVGADLTSSSGT